MFGDIVPRSMFEDAIDQALHTDRLEALPGLGVPTTFCQFSGATNTALMAGGGVLHMPRNENERGFTAAAETDDPLAALNLGGQRESPKGE
jgi:hypothetical protein